jgi:hypothetical protein
MYIYDMRAYERAKVAVIVWFNTVATAKVALARAN